MAQNEFYFDILVPLDEEKNIVQKFCVWFQIWTVFVHWKFNLFVANFVQNSVFYLIRKLILPFSS